MMNSLSPLLLARYQMAFTLGFHIIFACIGVGMPILLLIAEHLSLKKNDPTWRMLAQRWSKVFAVLFAVGAVSGTLLSFELGLLWPKFMGTFGGVIGLPFTLEGFAFFIEAIFVGIYLYGWERLSPRAHWWTGVPVAIAGFASACFVITANAWMNTPRGFEMIGGVVTQVSPLAAMMNPSSLHQTVHMILAAYMVTGFLVASIYAFLWLRGQQTSYHKKALQLGLWLGVLCTFPQMLVGDWSGRVVARDQPVKLAAMEGLFHTQTHAPLLLGGIPDTTTETVRYGLEIPSGLSLMLHFDPNAEVAGLDAVPPSERPPVVVVHIAFQIMMAMAGLLALIATWTVFNWYKKRDIPQHRLFYMLLVPAGAAAILALEAGWTVTEVGRQPWIVHGFMKTADAVTHAPNIGTVFFVTMSIYLILSIGCVAILRYLASKPLSQRTHNDA